MPYIGSVSFLHLAALCGILAVVASALLLAIGVYLGNTRLWQHIALLHTQRAQQGYVAPQYTPALVGQEGLTQTPLRPAGKVCIQGCTYQATTEGTYLPPQVTVVVTAILGHTLVVQLLPAT